MPIVLTYTLTADEEKAVLADVAMTNAQRAAARPVAPSLVADVFLVDTFRHAILKPIVDRQAAYSRARALQGQESTLAVVAALPVDQQTAIWEMVRAASGAPPGAK